MSWTDEVDCPCGGPTTWAVIDGSWTCGRCMRTMTVAEIEVMHKRQDALDVG